MWTKKIYMYSYDVTKSSPNFRGMTKVFKNKIFIDGQKDIEGIINKRKAKNPDAKLIVGQLPAFIFRKLPKENRPQIIAEIMNMFAEVTNDIREYVPPIFSMDTSLMRRPEFVNKKLTDLFQKYKVITKWDDINLEYLGQGGKGKGFKISGLRDFETEDELVIKVFHQIKGAHWHPFKSHGNYAENNNAIYWKHQEGFDTQRGKFFWGDLESGYLISKCIDEDTRLPQRIVDEANYGIKCTDEEKTGVVNGYNRLKGYNFDYGGRRGVNRVKNGQKVSRSIYNKLQGLSPEEVLFYWNKIYSKKHLSEREEAGLALGIKFLSPKHRCEYIDMCLEDRKPLVEQALGYVLKYLPHKDALKYFRELAKTKDSVTQIILFNEMPLLSKKKRFRIDIKDDLNPALEEIEPERIYELYQIAHKYAKPDTIEHLASYVHLLPLDKVEPEYNRLKQLSETNPVLKDRLKYKFPYIKQALNDAKNKQT